MAMLETWTLLVFMTLGGLSGEVGEVRHLQVDGFLHEEECKHAARAVSGTYNGLGSPVKNMSVLCIRKRSPQ
jgi:hypothetical protein